MTSKKLTMKTTRLALSALAVAALSVTASAQLTLDSFPTGNSGKNYVKSITAPSSASHYEGLPSGSLLGAARETIFTIGSNPYSQTSTLDVGNGILIVDTGFQVPSALTIGYGFSLSGKEVPLGLNLGSYSGLQLNFAGSNSLFDLDVDVTVFPNSGGYYSSVAILTPSYYPYSVALPFTSFTGGDGGNGGLTPTEASDISYIIIEFYGGYTQSYGVTSFQAYN